MGNTCLTQQNIYDTEIIKSEYYTSNKDDIFKEMANIPIDKQIMKLYDYDYAIFFSRTFLDRVECIKTNIQNYFNSNNIAYLEHNDKNNIITLIKKYNNEIEGHKYKVVKSGNEDADKFKVYIHKPIYFYDNIIDADILYKKISFAKQELFIPFDLYIIKKMEYKIKSFCQITERLGVERIKINYNSNILDSKFIKLNVKSFDVSNGVSIKDTEEKTDELSIVLDYPDKDQNYGINLNKTELHNLIMDEKTFLISSEEYLADMDLQYLIDSRCDNYIINYNTSFKINKTNEFERSFISSFENLYGLKLSKQLNHNESIDITINIKFINMYDNACSIDGSNINSEKYGFHNLCNFIKEELSEIEPKESEAKESELIKEVKVLKKDEMIKPYIKIKKFLYNNIKYIVKNQKSRYIKILLNDDDEDLKEIFKKIFYFNFNNIELHELFYKYFKDDLTYGNFKTFRNVVMNGIDNYNKVLAENDIIITKFHFTSYMIHDIHYHQYCLINKLSSITDKYCKKLVYNIEDLRIKYGTIFINKFIDRDVEDPEEYKLKNIKEIKALIIKAFLKSFYYKNGIAYNNIEDPNLIHEFRDNDNEIINDGISHVSLNDNYMLNIEKNQLFSESNYIKNKYDSKTMKTIMYIIKNKFSYDLKKISLPREELFDLFENITNEMIEYMDNKVEQNLNCIDTCSYEVNGIYLLTRIIDMVTDITYMCFNEYNEYKQFNKYKPNKNKYSKKLIETITNNKMDIIIQDIFYETFPIEKLYSNYRFNKIYFTFDDFLKFITIIDNIFAKIATEGKKRGITEEECNIIDIKKYTKHPVYNVFDTALRTLQHYEMKEYNHNGSSDDMISNQSNQYSNMVSTDSDDKASPDSSDTTLNEEHISVEMIEGTI